MLVHHFEAETQGLLTKMTEGKPMSPKITFSESNIFLGGRGKSGRIKATGSPMHITGVAAERLLCILG